MRGMPTLFLVLFPALLAAMVVVWFATVAWVIRRLRNRHAEAYEQLGSPNFIWIKSQRNQWLFAKLILSRQHRELGDQTLSRVIIFMRAWFVAYFVLFLALLISISFANPK